MKQHSKQTSSKKRSFSDNVEEAVSSYFSDLNGHNPQGIYDLFLAEFEKPVFKVVMAQVDNNLSKAAAILGMNRTTLRKRLGKYNLI